MSRLSQGHTLGGILIVEIDAEASTGDLVLDVSQSCAWCFADGASEQAWAIQARLQASANREATWAAGWEFG
jgi:hypothetical protein